MTDTTLVDRVRSRLASTATDITPAVVAQAVREEAGGVVGDADVLSALHLMRQEFVGAGPLDPLLRADLVTDVLVTAPDQVWLDGDGGLRRTDVTFPDEDAVRRLAQRLALACGRRLDDAQPFVDAWLPVSAHGRVRLHAVLPPVAADGTCLSLRVLRRAGHTLDDLRHLGTFDERTQRVLEAVVAARLAFVVTGGTGAGKTSLLSALLTSVDPSERIVSIEDAGELAPDHPQFVRLIARPPNVEGAGEVTLADLVRQGLRMRPDRLIVGEVRGSEVCDLLTALNTGHDGGAGTVHANSPAELPARMEALAALGGLSRPALHSQLAAAFQVVLHLRRHPDGTRRLAEIGVLDRLDNAVWVVPTWHADDPHPSAELADLLESRGVTPPW
ncbi:TadA family conjugal transfer-associated ATPase [Actinophytocola gossypii]|uniref:TadA family conjugal transfer-associated ATPase n=1 Tax=Actinophytocola gossypii TaxID=2812003 RepID=A0ABT2J3R9_9PSEU|nr:TadA family conjugal transfer-associated ATPase [Actinophytocola gossypii]MCT2582497.1 TadA family conjugal transfer-associated ATPase [Actinophytocola gossypii]